MIINISRPAGGLGKPKRKPLYCNSAKSQRARLLKFFETCPRISTIEARQKLGILSPPARILELRLRYLIDTVWIKQPDSNGVLHRVGLYIFKGERKEASHAIKH
jgi:hypothetical protein